MVAGALFVAAFLLARARNLRAPDPAAPTSEVLAHERAQIERQARLLERVWIWYLAPLLPSVALIYADSLQRALARSDGAPGTGVGVIVALFAASLGLFVLIGWINRRAARRLRERMAPLPPAGGAPPLDRRARSLLPRRPPPARPIVAPATAPAAPDGASRGDLVPRRHPFVAASPVTLLIADASAQPRRPDPRGGP